MLLSLTQPDYSSLLLPSSSTANNVSVWRQKQDEDREQQCLCTSLRLKLGQSWHFLL